MFFVAEPNLLYLLVRTLETAYALVINPYSHRWFSSLLDSYQPVLVGIHGHNVVGMPLHEELFASVDIPTNQYTTSWVVDFLILEDEIRIMQWAKGKGSIEF